ncbi:MAG: SRPBCC family protein [Deltaproteobacteria bacterium]|nr:SRPBCC family protein [Deltaproteobacteria bacterium]
MVSQKILIKAPIETVFNSIVDFANYPKFLPEIKSAKIDRRKDREIEVSFKINLIKEINYTLKVELDPPSGVYWKLKKGDLMKSNEGSWELKAKGDTVTEAVYSIDVTFGLWVPNAITEALVAKNLPQTLKRFKKRAEGLHRKS